MLEKYRETIDSLSHEQAALLRQGVRERHSLTVTEDESLYEALSVMGLDQSDLVMSLAESTRQDAIELVQVLVGAEVRRYPQGETAIDPVTNRYRDREPPRPTQHRSDGRTVLEVAPNPKRRGTKSHERYETWEVGASVTEMLKKGLTPADVKWDTERGFVKLSSG